MALNKYLDVSPEVAQALAEGRPVVALESTIISHGMPYPQNVETALAVERIIRENGAVPATIAIIGGRLKAGCSKEEIEHLGRAGTSVAKASRRDLAVLCARGQDGATTVTTTMIIAHMAGIKVFATGGIGGVHRGAETTISTTLRLSRWLRAAAGASSPAVQEKVKPGSRWAQAVFILAAQYPALTRMASALAAGTRMTAWARSGMALSCSPPWREMRRG